MFAQFFMASTLSHPVYLLSWIIEELDHPFWGVWNIEQSSMDALSKRFESELT